MLEAIQISRNLIKGCAVENSETLINMARNKQSVYHSNWGVKPASVIINMNFIIVQKMITENRLFTTIKLTHLKSK